MIKFKTLKMPLPAALAARLAKRGLVDKTKEKKGGFCLSFGAIEWTEMAISYGR